MTSSIETYAKYKPRWGSIVYFIGLTLVTLLGVPLYILRGNLVAGDVWLFAVYGFLCTLAITSGYHRLYSHRSYKTNSVIEFLLLGLGAATAQQSALKWAALHRQHHRYVDTDRDPYNIRRGFFHAHMGWLLFWKFKADYGMVKDMQANRLVMHQHQHFQAWTVITGLLLPLGIGLMYGSVMGAFLIGVVARLFVVYQCTFFINSAAHTLGTAAYDEHYSARDHWIGAVLTNGEGYHNFHHRFPSDYRNGVRWYHWDPGKWFIWTLGKLGMAWDLRVTPEDVRLKELSAPS